MQGISFGTSAETFRIAWESQMATSGFRLRMARVRGELALLDDQGRGVVVEGVADRLDLGQDEPPLRRLEVDRDDQDREPPRRQEIAHERRRFDEIVRGHLDEVALDGLQGGLPPGGIDAGEGDDPACLFSVSPGRRVASRSRKAGEGGRRSVLLTTARTGIFRFSASARTASS